MLLLGNGGRSSVNSSVFCFSNAQISEYFQRQHTVSVATVKNRIINDANHSHLILSISLIIAVFLELYLKIAASKQFFFLW